MAADAACAARVVVFEVLGRRVRVRCDDAAAREVLLANYGALIAAADDRVADLHYAITCGELPKTFALSCQGRPAVAVPDLGELVYCLEQDLTVVLQRERPDLLFLHAAALERGGRAYLLAGDSGHGKSTTCWGLLHHGFRYLSDELGPIELETLQVLPYPHALCLKQQPPPDYPLPSAGLLDLGATLHVAVAALPAPAASGPCGLAAVLFVHYRGELDAPVLQPVGTAEASARLYASTLNALAHRGKGLDAVMHVAASAPCYRLDAADLRGTCELVTRLADGGAF